MHQIHGQLAELGVLVEEFGGDAQSVCISVPKKFGLSVLEESMTTLTEILELESHAPVVSAAASQCFVVENQMTGGGPSMTIIGCMGSVVKGQWLVVMPSDGDVGASSGVAYELGSTFSIPRTTMQGIYGRVKRVRSLDKEIPVAPGFVGEVLMTWKSAVTEVAPTSSLSFAGRMCVGVASEIDAKNLAISVNSNHSHNYAPPAPPHSPLAPLIIPKRQLAKPKSKESHLRHPTLEPKLSRKLLLQREKYFAKKSESKFPQGVDTEPIDPSAFLPPADLELQVVVKADVDGSLEALTQQLFLLHSKLHVQPPTFTPPSFIAQKSHNGAILMAPTNLTGTKLLPKIKLKLVQQSLGALAASDLQPLMLTSYSASLKIIKIIIAFNLPPISKSLNIPGDVTVLSNRVIYALLEDLQSVVKEALGATLVCNYVGEASVLQLFNGNMVAGCKVVDGSITRENCIVQCHRNGALIWTGQIKSLKHLKNDVPTVRSGIECGIVLDEHASEVGDTLQCFSLDTQSFTLESFRQQKLVAPFPALHAAPL